MHMLHMSSSLPLALTPRHGLMTRSLSSPGPHPISSSTADGRPLQRGSVCAVRGSFRDGEGCVHMTCTRTCPARLSVAACNLGPTAQHTLATHKQRSRCLHRPSRHLGDLRLPWNSSPGRRRCADLSHTTNKLARPTAALESTPSIHKSLKLWDQMNHSAEQYDKSERVPI